MSVKTLNKVKALKQKRDNKLAKAKAEAILEYNIRMLFLQRNYEPKYAYTFPHYGSIGGVGFEDATIKEARALLKDFPPIRFSAWVSSNTRYNKPIRFSNNLPPRNKRVNHCGVTYRRGRFGNILEWMTKLPDGTYIRVRVELKEAVIVSNRYHSFMTSGEFYITWPTQKQLWSDLALRGYKS